MIDQAARRLGVSRRTIYYKIRSGELRTIRTLGGSQRVLAGSIDELKRIRERQVATMSGTAPTALTASDAKALALQIEALA